MTVKRQAVILIEAFLSVWAIIRISGLGTGGIISLILFTLISFFYYHNTFNANVPDATGTLMRLKITSRILGALFSLCFIAGGASGILDGLEQKVFCAFILLVTGLGLYFISAHVLFYLYHRLRFFSFRQTGGMSVSYRCFGWIGFSICMLGWLPCLLGNFPGVMTVDSFNQYAQIIGVYAYSNHHPWLHTLCFGLFYRLGLLFTDSPSLAVSFYTVFQMLFMASCAGYFINFLVHLRISRPILWTVALFFALVPYHGMFAVTIWKDVPFAGLFFLFGISLLQLALFKKAGERLRTHPFYLILFVLSGILMSLMRSNGWYTFLLCIPFLLFYFREDLKSILPACAAIAAAVLIFKGPVMDAYGVIQPDFVESLSIPLQQVARVIADGHALTEEDRTLLGQIMDVSLIPEEYDKNCSDNMKRLIRKGDQDYMSAHLDEYASLWLRLMREYPLEYYQAFVDQTWGYWYPEGEYPVVFNEIIPENEFGLESDALFHGPVYIKLKEILFKLHTMVPGYAALFHMGTMFWVIIACAGLVAVKGNYKFLIVYIPAIALVLTLMLAAPLYAELRYAYSLLFSMPLYLVAAMAQSQHP